MDKPLGFYRTKVPWPRDKSSGWTAFDLKQREKHRLESEFDKDPFPPMPNSLLTIPIHENSVKQKSFSDKPFSSMLIGPSKSEDSEQCQNPASDSYPACRTNDTMVAEPKSLALQKLRELNRWADDGLIEDVLATADYDVEVATKLLDSMSTDSNAQDDIGESNAETEGFTRNEKGTEDPFETAPAILWNGRSSFNDVYTKELLGSDICGRNNFKTIPEEPEWEEEDIYLSIRKDAIRMMRSGATHSKAAASAFQRGDHSSAQYHSVKAREHRQAAERFNSEAAKEILKIRNSGNDMWKLDLHGLHAAEAVLALQERLQRIERQGGVHRSVSPNRIGGTNSMIRAISHESIGSVDIENSATNIHRMCVRQRPSALQVVTGVGNHSRGHAALPNVVKSFLDEKGYRFEEIRPGVVTVRPKFRSGR